MKKFLIIIISIMTMFLIACNSAENSVFNTIINNHDTSEISADENSDGESTNNNELSEDTDDNKELESDTEEPEKEFAFASAEEIDNISDEDLLYIYNHDYDTYDFFPEGEYTGIDYFGKEMLVPTETCPDAPTECMLFFIEDCFSIDESELNSVIDSQKMKTFAEVDITDSIYSCNTSYTEYEPGKAIDDFKLILCGENDSYVEYTSTYTEINRYYDDNRVLVSKEIQKAHRWIYMKSLVYTKVEDERQLIMLGELSLDYVKEQMDIYNDYHKSTVLYREVAEEEDCYNYTCYYIHPMIGGEAQSSELYLLKEVIQIDKESHKVQYKSAEIVKTVDIP